MFKVQSPIIHSYTSSSSSSLPLESKLQTGSFLKKSTTNFSLKSLDSNGAISIQIMIHLHIQKIALGTK